MSGIHKPMDLFHPHELLGPTRLNNLMKDSEANQVIGGRVEKSSTGQRQVVNRHYAQEFPWPSVPFRVVSVNRRTVVIAGGLVRFRWTTQGSPYMVAGSEDIEIAKTTVTLPTSTSAINMLIYVEAQWNYTMATAAASIKSINAAAPGGPSWDNLPPDATGGGVNYYFFRLFRFRTAGKAGDGECIYTLGNDDPGWGIHRFGVLDVWCMKEGT